MLSQVVSSFRSPFQAILAKKQSIQDQMKFSTNSNELILPPSHHCDRETEQLNCNPLGGLKIFNSIPFTF